MKSVRQRLLEVIEADFRAVDLPEWPLKFSTGIVAGPEKERHTFPYIECNFTVGVEFRITVNRDDDRPALIAEEVLTVIKRVLTNNRSWNGLAVDSAHPQRDRHDHLWRPLGCGGWCCEVMFRHSHLDPRNENPDV